MWPKFFMVGNLLSNVAASRAGGLILLRPVANHRRRTT